MVSNQGASKPVEKLTPALKSNRQRMDFVIMRKNTFNDREIKPLSQIEMVSNESASKPVEKLIPALKSNRRRMDFVIMRRSIFNDR